jgi:hypothetical protein
MPFLVSVRTGLPVQAPTYWVTASRRSWGCQPNTLYNDLRSLIFLYLWADARGVDLQDRFKSGALLTLAEITDLDTFCGRYTDEAIAELPGQAAAVIRLAVRDAKARRRTVNLLEKRNRLAAIHSFIEFTTADHLSHLQPWPARWSHYDSVRHNCLEWIRSRYQALKKRGRNDIGSLEGHDEAALARLRAVIEPDHLENPAAREGRPITSSAKACNEVLCVPLADRGLDWVNRVEFVMPAGPVYPAATMLRCRAQSKRANYESLQIKALTVSIERIGPGDRRGETHADALEESRLVRQLRHSHGAGTLDAKFGLRLVCHVGRSSNHLVCFAVRHVTACRRFRAGTHLLAHPGSRGSYGQDR